MEAFLVSGSQKYLACYNIFMQILMVTEFFSSLDKSIFSGGVETRCFYVAKYLAQKNKVVVFARKKRNEISFESLGNLQIYRFGKEVIETKASIFSIFSRFTFTISCLVKSFSVKFDIVEGSNFVTYIPAYIIGLIKRKPIVAFYPDVLLGQWRNLFGKMLGLIGEIVEKITIKLPWAGYIAISNTVKNKLQRINIKPNKITVIPCGVDTKTYSQTKSNSDKLIIISRLVKYKRIDWAIRLLKKLELEYPQLTLTIIGDGPEIKNLESLINNLSLNSKINILSNISGKELIQELGKARLLIHPSLIEGFGIVLVEANASGVPFVAANIPTSQELIDNLGGELFVNNDFEDMAIKVKQLLKDETKWKQLSQKGIKGSKNYEWSLIAKNTEDYYQKLLNS